MPSHENKTIRLAQSGQPQAIILALLGAAMAFGVRMAGMVKGPVLVIVPFGALFGYGVGRAIFGALLGGGERLAKELVFPDAEGTYAPQYSHIDALEVQEKFAEALEAWLVVAAERPNNPSPLLRAADLQLRKLNDPQGALPLYEQVRRMPKVRDEHIRYASQKIIDIHLAPGGDEGRALVELRRFVERFPEGREAEGAKAAIARIKAQREAAG
jgi:hypothetical protein